MISLIDALEFYAILVMLGVIFVYFYVPYFYDPTKRSKEIMKIFEKEREIQERNVED